MKRRHLSLVALVLALGACNADMVDRALAPTAPALARRGSELPFHGTLAAKETDQFDPATNRVLIHLDAAGTATHVGRYALVMNLSLNPATGMAVGQLVITAADGSTLTANVTGFAPATPSDVFVIVETATITGGTRRFAGATGRIVIERTIRLSTGVSSGAFDGTLSLGE
jgi:hypothetical protein